MVLVCLASLGCGADATGRAGAVTCGGFAVPLVLVQTGRGADELGAYGSAALGGGEVPAVDDLSAWSVVTESATELVLIRELPPLQPSTPGDVLTHEIISVGASGNPEVSESWTLREAGPCALRVQLGNDLEPAIVDVDPAAVVDPGTDTVALLVTERKCNSGGDAQGRIEVAELVETDVAVTVVLGVRPRGGDADCQSNPPTPYRLQLVEPLGDRALLDGSVVPAQTLAPAVAATESAIPASTPSS